MLENRRGRQGIYIEIDAILDTRIATVAMVNPDAAAELVSDERYWNRISDEFSYLIPGFDDAAYQTAYRNRNTDLLPKCRPTGMMLALEEILRELEVKLLAGNPDVEETFVDLNIWPYDLTPEEQNQMAECVRTACCTVTPVNIISLPYQQITFDHVRSAGWALMLMYNFSQWVDESFKNYTKDLSSGAPSVTLMTPAIVRSREELMDPKNLQLPNGNALDPFDVTAASFGTLVGLEFVATKYFSLVRFNTGEKT